MNDSEARRRELLRQTRRLCHETERNRMPVHPRYQSTFDSEQEEHAQSNSFLFRLGLAILCFVCFVWADYGKLEFSHVTSSQIADQIEKQLTPKEIKEELIQGWKAL